MKVTQNPTPHSLPLEKSVSTDKAVETSINRHPHSHETGATRGGASVEISDNARLMSRAAELAKSAPDVRADKVAALKKAIAEGTYQVDSGEIADRLLEEHLNSDFGKNQL